MAVNNKNSSEVKIFRQGNNNINGYAYRIDDSNLVSTTKTYFRNQRCVNFPKTFNENSFDLDNFDLYSSFKNDIENIKKGMHVSSLAGLPTTNLTLTMLKSEVDINKEFQDFTTNNKRGAINSHLAETLNYLFGDGDTKQKTKKILESMKKKNPAITKVPKLKQTLFDDDGNIIVKKKRGRKRAEDIPVAEPVEKKKRGRPPLNKTAFRVFVPEKNKTSEPAENKKVDPLPAVPIQSVIPVFPASPASAPSAAISKVPIKRRRPTTVPKLKKFSAFADSYTPLNQVENSEVVEYLNLEILPQSLLATVKTEFASENEDANISNKELIEQSFIRLYQSCLLAKMRYENGDKNRRKLYENDICKIYVNLMCELLKKLDFPEDQALVDEYFKGVVFENDEERYKYKLKGEQTVFKSSKMTDSDKVLLLAQVIVGMTAEKAKPLVHRLLTVENPEEYELPTVLISGILLKLNRYEDKKIFDKIVLVSKEILSDGPKASSYYQFLSLVADNLLPDLSNMEDIKSRIPFDLLFLDDSDIKDDEKTTLVKLFSPLKLQIDKAKGISKKENKPSDLMNKVTENVKKEAPLTSAGSGTSTESFDLNDLFCDGILLTLGIRDFNGRTSEDLKMESRFNELKQNAIAEGKTITEELETELINQVAKDEAHLIFMQASQKLKKGRKIKKNYVLPPKPVANSVSYTQEIKKYNAAKEYLRDPANTSLRVVCQNNKISVPTLITYMDAGRVSRMMITGRYSGSTVIRDSSFNNRGKSLYPDEIKGVFLQKTYEQLLEAKRSSLNCNIPNESKVSARLSIAKHEQLEDLKKNAAENASEPASKDESVDSRLPSSSIADVSGNISVTTTTSSAAPAVQRFLTNRVDKLSVKYPVLRLPYQENFASDVLDAETKDSLANVIKTPILSMIEIDDEATEEFDFEYLSADCIYSMSNTVAAVVDSNFDFGSFLGGVFKKKKSNLFKKYSEQLATPKTPKTSDGADYAKDKSCFKLIQFKET